MKTIIYDTDGKIVEFDKPIVISFPTEDNKSYGIHVSTLKEALEFYFKNRPNLKSFKISPEIPPEKP